MSESSTSEGLSVGSSIASMVGLEEARIKPKPLPASELAPFQMDQSQGLVKAPGTFSGG